MKKCLILVILWHIVCTLEDNQIKKLTQYSKEDVIKHVKELEKNGTLEEFFKNLKYSLLDNVVKDFQKVTFSKANEVRNEYFASKINGTIECLKLALKHEDSNTGRPVLDPWTPPPFPLTVDLKEFLWTNLFLSDVKLEDCSNFDTVSLTFSNTFLQETEKHFHKVSFTSNYEGEMKWFGIVNTKGKGNLRFELEDIVIKSRVQYNSAAPPLLTSIDYKGSTVGKVLIRITNLHKDEQISEWLSEFLSKATHKILNENMDEIFGTLSKLTLDYFNKNHGKNLTFLDFLDKLVNFKCAYEREHLGGN